MKRAGLYLTGTRKLSFERLPEKGDTARSFTDQDMVERCIYAMIHESARVLEEGHAARAVDIDVIYLTGFGFPSYRGGPMCYADTVGLKNICGRVMEFRRQGESWKPAALFERLAEEGSRFAAFDANSQQSVAAV